MRKKIPVLVALLVVSGAATSLAQPAGKKPARDLFTAAPSATGTAQSFQAGPEALDPAIVRSRFVGVNLDNLAELDSIGLNVFDDVTVVAIKDRVEQRSTDSYTWFGRLDGVESSSVVLTIEKGDLVGQITLQGQMYHVRPMGDGLHVVRQLDPSKFPKPSGSDSPVPKLKPNQEPNEKPPIELTGELALPMSQLDDGSMIDIMIVYTDDVARATSNVGAEIQHAIDVTNQTYANSFIDQRLRLVHTAEVNYDEPRDADATLDCISLTADSCLDEVHAWRDTYHADLVSLFVENGMNCNWLGCWVSQILGIGYLLTSVATDFAPYGFTVVNKNYAADSFTLAHEAGHNMGAHHDVHVAGDDETVYPYSHGYIWNYCTVWPACYCRQTVMAYADRCNDLGNLFPERLPFWSNPRITYEICEWPFNWPCTGAHPLGDAASADNARTLNQTASTVANFRQSNRPPTSQAGGPYFVQCQGSSTSVSLNGGGSNDPDGDALTYSWTTNCPSGSFSDRTAARPTLSMPTSAGCSASCTVFLAVTDDHGLSSASDAAVNILDSAAPVITPLPANVTWECGTPVPPAPALAAKDQCDPTVVPDLSEEQVAGSCPAEYTLTRTWTAADDCGNTASHTQTITVQDTTAPALSAHPVDLVLEFGQPVPDPPTIGATDACDSTAVPAFTEKHTQGSCPGNYSLARTWTAADACGNTESYTQTIRVGDTLAPAIVCNTPAAMTPPDAPVSFRATATDPSTVSVAIMGVTCVGPHSIRDCQVSYAGDTITILDSGGVGDTISWTVRATDACGNSSESICSIPVVNPGRRKNQ